MKWNRISKVGIAALVFFAGFSSALVVNKLDVYSKTGEAVDYIKRHVRPAAVWVGLKEPVQVALQAESPRFIDVQRDFVKRVSVSGVMTMSELPGGTNDFVFKESKLIGEAPVDAIYERFTTSGIQRRITYNPESEEFPINLVRLIASVVKHGAYDDANSFETSMKTLETRQLSMTCGSVTLFAQRVLKEIGVRSRVITTLTLDEWNTYSNGHTILEVFVPRKKSWVAVDLDTNKMFSTGRGELASALDLADQGVGGMTLKDLTSTPVLDYSGFPKYQATAEFMIYDMLGWYKRMFQVIAIFDEQSQKYIFMTDDKGVASRVSSYASNYSALGRDEFKKIFYPEL